MLTRLLYPVEHVKQNILECILHNEKQELSYWLAEYYYSGFKQECMNWIIQIYYTYYALQYPSWEKKLHEKIKKYKTTYSYPQLVHIANNLRIKKHSNEFNNAIQQPKQTERRGRKPSCIGQYLEPYKSLMTQFIKKDWNCLYGKLCTLTLNELYEFYCAISLYYNAMENDIISYYNKITQYYSNDSIIRMIFALCLHVSNPNRPTIDQYGIWLPDKKTLTQFTDIQTTKNSYRFLNANIKYKNRQHLSKQQLIDILENWLLYTYNTPIWRERVEEFGGYIENNTVKFSNDDTLENFDQLYGYELDEQSNKLYSLLYSVSFSE